MNEATATVIDLQARFQLINSLKAEGAISQDEAEGIEIELPAVSGAPIMGELTRDEIQVYLVLAEIEHNIEEAVKELTARSLHKAGDTIRSAKSIDDFVHSLQERESFKTDEEAEEFFAEVLRHRYLKSRFWWIVRNRLATWGSDLEIRAGYKVVRVGMKYQKVSG